MNSITLKQMIVGAFFLLCMTMSVGMQAEDVQRPVDQRTVISLEDLQVSTEMNDDLQVEIHYLLDSEGRPYVISIRSSDELVSRMILEMLGEADEVTTEMQDPSLAITFYYQNIR